jgi:hypothetical protein
MARKKLPTTKTESFKTFFKRQLLNFFPTYWFTGGRAIFLSDDLSEIQIRLPLKWRTRNYVGTLFGGSQFSASDPIYMLQLIYLLGKEYVVWDKSAAIRYIRPGNKTLYARFVVSDELLDSIRKEIKTNKEMDLSLDVDFVDLEGRVYSHVDKLLYIADKTFYKKKKAKRKAEKENQS